MDLEVRPHETSEIKNDLRRLETKEDREAHRDRGHPPHENEDQVQPLRPLILLDTDESFIVGIAILLHIMILRNMGMIQIGAVAGREVHHIRTLHEVDINTDISILPTFVLQTQIILLRNELLLRLHLPSSLIQALNL